MWILKDASGCDSRDRLSIVAYAAAVFYVLVCAYARAVSFPLPSLCPWRAIGAHCPGCGMTRAFSCLITGDYLLALHYNPLILVVAPYVFYNAVDILAAVVLGRSIVIELPRWFTSSYQAIFVAGCFGLGAIRILSWLVPSCNPLQIGLPGA